MHSISTRAERQTAAATVDRAGGSFGKYVAYTAFIAWIGQLKKHGALTTDRARCRRTTPP
jgi:hypothetical protein